MQGTVIHYNPESREGMIFADNGARLIFRGLEWQSPTPPEQGSYVQFSLNGDKVEDIYFIRKGEITSQMMQALQTPAPAQTASQQPANKELIPDESIPNPYNPPVGKVQPQNQYPVGGPPGQFQRPPPECTESVISLVLAILPFFTALFFPLSIIAVVLGHIAIGKIRRSNGTIGGHGLAVAGLIVGYIGIVLIAIVLLIIVVAISAANR